MFIIIVNHDHDAVSRVKGSQRQVGDSEHRAVVIRVVY